MSSYYIIKSYAVKQNLISRRFAELIWSCENCKADVFTEADVIIRKDDDHLYQVDLIVDINAMTADVKTSVYDIHIIYSSHVFIDDLTTDKEKEEILMVEVPNKTTINIREIVKQLTTNAGYTPLLIDDFHFSHPMKKSKQDKKTAII